MSFILPLLFLLGSGSLLSLCFRKRIERTLPLAMVLSSLLIYVFSCFRLLIVGEWLAIAAAVASVPLLIVWIVRGDAAKARKLLLTPGLVAFLLIYVFVFVLNLNRGYTAWDEFSFWGVAVKETVRTGQLHVFPEASILLHKSYPPMTTIFQSFWCMLCGGYREAYAYRALQTLSLSMFLPVLSAVPQGRRWRAMGYILCSLVAIVGTTLSLKLGSATFYATIYMDGPIAVMFAYTLYCVFDEQRSVFATVQLCAALTFLAMSKQVGAGLVLLTLCVLATDRYLQSRHSGNPVRIGRPTRSALFRGILLVGVPLAFWCSWKLLVALLGVDTRFSTGSIDLSALPKIFANASGYETQRSILGKMCRALLETTLTSRPITLSYLQLLVVCIAAFTGLSYYLRSVWSCRRTAALSVWLTIGGLGYAAALTLMYIFSFPIVEALRLASYTRYMNLYGLALFSLMTMLFLRAVGQKARDEAKPLFRPALALAAVFWVLLLPGTMALDSLKPALNPWSMSAYCEPDATIINQCTESDSRIFILDERGDSYALFNIQYQIAPRKVNEQHFSLGKPLDENDRYSVALTVEEWRDELSGYDYLYLYTVDDAFAAEYAPLFPQGQELAAMQLYRIDIIDGLATLSLVERS